MKLINLLVCGFLLALISHQCMAEQDVIDIDFNHHNHSLSINHCFSQSPDYLSAKDDLIVSLTSQMRWQSQSVYFQRGYVNIPNNEPGCISYVIMPKRSKKTSHSNNFRQQHPDSLLLSIDSMLWQSNEKEIRPLPKIRINHAVHIKVSAPWKLINRTATSTEYQMKPTPKYSNGFVAFGPLALQNITLGDSNLRLAIMHGTTQTHNQMIEQWVTAMAGSVAQVGESFPLTDIQVLVILIKGQSGVVPWGQVNRAGGQGVLFVVNPNETRNELFADWTAAHEFSHLLTPYTPNDRWLSEGFASYHQNISRLRAGLLDEKTAWSKLIAGFERGRKSAAKRSAPKLKKADRRHNMQMYWGGAVIALKADVALQEVTEGRMNLSKALAGLQDCCLDTGKSWTASALFVELDRITETHIFTELYQQEVQLKSYPNYKTLLEELGIEKNYYGGIRINNSAPKAHIRKKIARG